MASSIVSNCELGVEETGISVVVDGILLIVFLRGSLGEYLIFENWDLRVAGGN
jgi:hypothetical protein